MDGKHEQVSTYMINMYEYNFLLDFLMKFIPLRGFLIGTGSELENEILLNMSHQTCLNKNPLLTSGEFVYISLYCGFPVLVMEGTLMEGTLVTV